MGKQTAKVRTKENRRKQQRPENVQNLCTVDPKQCTRKIDENRKHRNQRRNEKASSRFDYTTRRGQVEYVYGGAWWYTGNQA